MTVSAPVATTMSRSSRALPEPRYVAGSGEVRRWSALQHDRSGRLGEQRQLAQAALGVLDGSVGPHAGQDDAFQAHLPVLDLGDVLELGGQADDASQRVPLLEFEVPGRRVRTVVQVMVTHMGPAWHGRPARPNRRYRAGVPDDRPTPPSPSRDRPDRGGWQWRLMLTVLVGLSAGVGAACLLGFGNAARRPGSSPG
jgi:hypothetical protein